MVRGRVTAGISLSMQELQPQPGAAAKVAELNRLLNFERTRGDMRHFGLVAVNRADIRHMPKASAHRLGPIARANRI